MPPSWAPVSCHDDDSTSSFALLAGKYSPDDIQKPLPGNCTVALMPVLGYQGAVAADYDRLMKRGFLLEHSYTAADCALARRTAASARSMPARASWCASAPTASTQRRRLAVSSIPYELPHALAVAFLKCSSFVCLLIGKFPAFANYSYLIV
jgi:hypothetical protein